MTPLGAGLREAAARLRPHRDALVSAWAAAVDASASAPFPAAREFCGRTLDRMLDLLGSGRLEQLLADETAQAESAAQAGASLVPLAAAVRVLDRCCLPFLLSSSPDAAAAVECLTAIAELGHRRLEILLRAQEQESARRLHALQDEAARAAETARETARTNDALRLSEARSQHRADQIALLNAVARRIARIVDQDQLMQDAAEVIQARMSHTYVAVVVVDDAGSLVGRWAARTGVDRLAAGRREGAPGGIIGRAIRKRAPQVVPDVAADPDYHADVVGTRSEMVIPLLEGGRVLGAVDFQSEKPAAFDLDAVAAGETVAEFLVVALRNARLLEAARKRETAGG